MRHRIFLQSTLLLLAIAVTIVGTPLIAQAQTETLTIAAANSLRDAFRKVLPLFEAQHKEINVRVVYGPSQTLRKQIEEGAPVDVFLPSLNEEIDQLEEKGLVLLRTKRVYAGTSLVLITSATLPAPVGSIHDLRVVPIRRIAIGDPKTSSVGKVTAQFLRHSQLDPHVKPHYVLGEHSRAVLDLVANGEAELGVVYRTDAFQNTKVRILDTAPPDSHAPVRYGVTAVWTTKNMSGAEDFINFLLTPQVQTLLQENGFDPAPQQVGTAQPHERQ